MILLFSTRSKLKVWWTSWFQVRILSASVCAFCTEEIQNKSGTKSVVIWRAWCRLAMVQEDENLMTVALLRPDESFRQDVEPCVPGLFLFAWRVIQIYEGSGLNFSFKNICGVDCNCGDADFLPDFGIKTELSNCFSRLLKRWVDITCLITFEVLLFLNETHQNRNKVGFNLSAVLDAS